MASIRERLTRLENKGQFPDWFVQARFLDIAPIVERLRMRCTAMYKPV
jgi:hypothetical protein